uniref:Spondin-like TSP1 domain-containing protein n=1 Tax=Alexandrium andersonii TaxID=327968 RepID=A0A7S2AEL5_9DINO
MDCPSELMQTTGCSSVACESPDDCLVSDWQAWSSCESTCGLGQRQRRREVVRARSGDGAGCRLELSQVAACMGQPCPEHDCLWADWSEWGECSASCGGGQRSRSHEITRMPSDNGRVCEAVDKEETWPCNVQACVPPPCQDGAWAEWGGWSSCSTSCGGGFRHRMREVARTANECGSPPFGDARQEEFCKVASCEPTYDCTFSDWEGWSDCSAACSGTMTRKRHISQYGSGKGSFCSGSLQEMWPCNPRVDEPTPDECSTKPPVDCLLSHWTEWSSCTASCGGGEQSRSREVSTHPAHGGRPCDRHLRLARQCSSAPCPHLDSEPVDCEYGPWEDWGACSKCGGERTRFRHIVQHARNGGQACESFAAEHVGACPRQCDEPRFCNWGEWSEWGDCSARCGRGRRARKRHLGLSEAQAALPEPVGDLARRYATLRHAARELESRSGQELILAFGAGLLSFLLGLAAFRGALAARAGRVPVARGARSRAVNDTSYEAVASEFELSELGAMEAPLVSSL